MVLVQFSKSFLFLTSFLPSWILSSHFTCEGTEAQRDLGAGLGYVTDECKPKVRTCS